MYSIKYLKNFVQQVFVAMGSSEENAKLASDVLLTADLRGVDSHGVARLSGYVRLWKANRLNVEPNIKVIHETPSTAVIDGDKGVGLIVAPFAMKIAMEKANNVGTGWVAVRNSNHYGIAGYHAMMALEYDMIGWSMTNASPLVSPTFSKARMLGTNPISVAIPADKQPPLVIDMATTPVANGKLEVLQRKGEGIPRGWAQDENGIISTDAYVLKNGGAMLPLGSDRTHGSHKGYCLGSLVDILTAVLPGANYGPWVPPFVAYAPLKEEKVGEGIGHFLGAMRVDAFRPKEEFKSHMDNWINSFRNATPTDENQKVLIPGDPEREISEKRLISGLDLLPAVVEDLRNIAKEFNLTFK